MPAFSREFDDWKQQQIRQLKGMDRCQTNFSTTPLTPCTNFQ